jgi:hypothetical protein
MASNRRRYGKGRRRFAVVVLAGSFALPALLVAGVPSPAHACSPVPGGIHSRTVWPGDGNLPTNTRVVVSYGVGSSDGAIPAIGPDLTLLDADGSTVAITTEVSGTAVVIRPNAPLLPNHGYQIADRRAVPCGIGFPAGCELAAAPAVFASFTTGATADDAAPTFAGLSGYHIGDRSSCQTAGSCCSVYDINYVDLMWPAAADDIAGADVRYNVYRRDRSTAPALVATRISGTTLSGAAVCSGHWGGPELPAGFYMVRAVDWAGNEDANAQEVHIGDACAGGGVFSCSVDNAPPPATWPIAATIAAGMLVVIFGARIRPSRRRTRG